MRTVVNTHHHGDHTFGNCLFPAAAIVGNLHRACAELAGTPRGGPIDVPASLADMVAYNGGAPLTCLA